MPGHLIQVATSEGPGSRLFLALPKGVPERGRVGMLNHYEDSLVVRVHSQQALRADVEGTVEHIEELAGQIAEFASESVIKGITAELVRI